MWLLAGFILVSAAFVLRMRSGMRDSATGLAFVTAACLGLLLLTEIGIAIGRASQTTRRFVRMLLTAAALGLFAAVRMEWGRLDAIAGFAFLAAAALVSIVFTESVLARLKVPAAMRANVRLLVGTTLMLTLGTELVLRHGTTRYATRNERNRGRYSSPFQRGAPSRLFAYPPGRVISLPRAEFTHVRQVNAVGFTGDEIVEARTPREYRIVALGDSFTEGVGTGEESTWVRVVRQRLAERYPARSITALNAGISGSDPVYEYVLLDEKLVPYRPDLVVVAINTSDVHDVVVRGGTERFQPDGTVRYRDAPRWERFYALSFVARLLVHDVLRYTWLLMPPERLRREEQIAVAHILSTMRALRELCHRNGAGLLVVAHPFEQDVAAGQYVNARFEQLVRELEAEPGLAVADLLKVYSADGSITAETAHEFFWAEDLHHNTKGYRSMGEAIARYIVEAGWLEEEA